MRKSLLGTAILSSLLLVPLTSSATNPDDHFWTDSQGRVVRDGQGACVRTMYWSAETTRTECGGKAPVVVAKPAPAPVVVTPPPAPATAPEPVAPPPAPKPVMPPPPPKAKPITLRGDTSFSSGSSVLSSGARSEVAAVASQIKGLSKVKAIRISGHTDSRGGDAINQQLSEARANAVRNALIDDGIDGNVITATGYGASQPVADNKTASGRASNRRVEIEIDGE